MDKQIYRRFADAHAPRSPITKNCFHAFWVGGSICLLAQLLKGAYQPLFGIGAEDSGTLASVTLVFLAALLSGIGVFDRIAKFAGAGTLVPITGFANSVVSPAIDSKSEGLILGVGAKIFIISGPVLLYGSLAGAVYGVIYWIVGLL